MENRLVDMRELYQEWQDYHAHHHDNPVSQLSSSRLRLALGRSAMFALLLRC